MNTWHRILLIFLASTAAGAGEKPLDLTLDPSTFYRDDAEEPSRWTDENFQTPEQQRSEACRELAERIKAAKGLPQRRYSLQQQYQADCVE